MDLSERAKTNISKKDKNRYNTARTLFGIGMILLFIAMVSVILLLPPAQSMPLVDNLVDKIPKIPGPSPVFSATILLVSAVLIVGAGRELEKLDFDDKDIFMQKINTAMLEEDVEDAFDALSSAFSGQTPSFLPDSTSREAKKCIRRLSNGGTEVQKNHAVERITEHVHSSYEQDHRLKTELQELAHDEGQEEKESYLKILWDIVFGNVLNTKPVKIGFLIVVVVVLLALILLLSLTELKPVATVSATIFAGIVGYLMNEIRGWKSE